jgi:hypothetical protein
MFLEIGLIQRLSVFLSHPIYALGILLFTVIASTGIGSFSVNEFPLIGPNGSMFCPGRSDFDLFWHIQEFLPGSIMLRRSSHLYL